MVNFSRIRAENQFAFLGTGLLFGLNSIQIQNNLGATPIKYIGVGGRGLNQFPNQAQYTDLSINSNFIHEDIFIQQTGLSPINFFIFQDKNNLNSCYSLLSGYMSSYSARYSPNQVPQINSSFRFYNNVGNLPQQSMDAYASGQIDSIISTSNTSFNNMVADSNYINLTLDEYNTNRVIDYTFSININRLPIYNIGSRFPKKIETIFPINVSCNISFEADKDFVDVVTTDFPSNKKQQLINLNVYSNKTNKIIGTYSFKNMTLVSNDRGLASDGNLIINRQYVGQLFSFVGVSGKIPPAILDFGFSAASIDSYIDWGFSASPPSITLDFGPI